MARSPRFNRDASVFSGMSTVRIISRCSSTADLSWSFKYDHVCYNLSMKTIAAGEFKARCLTLMDDVRKNREPILITKRGKPVAKLVPAENEGRQFLGRLEGIIRIVGDIESPVEPPEAWDALK